MSRVHLVLLWHMHQPDYRDPVSGTFLLPWTRLHALKDYWGMVKLLEEFPDFHATFNLVPSLVRQLEQYASGQFQETWYDLAFRPAEGLSEAQRAAILSRAFMANRERMIHRWPRYAELYGKVNQLSPQVAARQMAWRDWRDLQVLSQLIWTDEEYLAHHPIIHALSEKGADFSEGDKAALRNAQAGLLAQVIPEYRQAAARNQIEISTSPFYHPILPLLIDSEVAREANPFTRLLNPAFRHPEDAWEQLQRARAFVEAVLKKKPTGLWPSEGSVSQATAQMAAEAGFAWLASDEGILGKTLNVGFGRDSRGVPENSDRLYSPHRLRVGDREIAVIFRDHYLSDLIGFVYARMEPAAAAEDLHRRLRLIGERAQGGSRPATVALILDGENAWETYWRGGRPFLREFYRRVVSDHEIEAMTVSEAIAAAGELPVIERLAPGSWINANFDIWCGDETDLQAWELLRDARSLYAKRNVADSIAQKDRDAAYESLLVAEGSDWCWWYGPEHASAEDVDFDALYRTRLACVYAALGAAAPDKLALPIKAPPRPSFQTPPCGYVSPKIDGLVTNYFEWMGAGLYAVDRRQAAMHGGGPYLGEVHYGFGPERFYLRLDPPPGPSPALRDCEFRIRLKGREELRISVRIEGGKLVRCDAETEGRPIAEGAVVAAFGRILEIGMSRDAVPVELNRLRLNVTVWQGGLPVENVPSEGWLEIPLGEEQFGWRPNPDGNV